MSGYIYAVECGQRVKIGFSKKPELRFNKIASDAPFPCELLGYWPGTIADEMEVHSKFHNTRVHGEWFASTEALLRFIADNAVPMIRKQRMPENEVDRIIEMFGGLTALARLLDCSVSTVQAWKLRNNIRPKHWPAIIRAAESVGISLTLHDFMRPHTAPERQSA